MHAVFKRCSVILCKTQETLDKIPRRYHERCRVLLEIGTENLAASNHSNAPVAIAETPKRAKPGLHLLYVGRLVHLKGVHLALPAFARLREQYPAATFTIIGQGPEERNLQQLTKSLRIENSIEWIPWLPREDVLQRYANYDALLFPSLHDSSSNAVLEALSSGLPVVCLKRGGPAIVVNDSCGIRVEGDSPEDAIDELTRALFRLAADEPLRQRLAAGALERAGNYFSWTQQTRRMNSVYASVHAAAASCTRGAS